MEHDYYHILDVPPSADLDTIKKAYRRKVMECHPDRGGSHGAMVLVNEAWEVLSNPELRLRYDAARARTRDWAAQWAAEADVQAARQRAEQYPRHWADVEAWLNSVAQDFASAKYGSVPLSGPMFKNLSLPTAGGSVSGWAFILIGAVLGGVFLSIPIGEFLCATPTINFAKNFIPEHILAMLFLLLIAGPVIGGAWAGALLHQSIGEEFKKAKEGSAREAQRKQEREASRPQPARLPTVASEARVLACERCGQKLRVPLNDSELLVTCKSCGHKFLVVNE